MRALKTYLAAAIVGCVLTAGVVRADTPAPVPAAAGAPQSAMVYVELQKADAQGLLSMAATMPVMRLIASTLHMSAMQTRFGLVEQLLHLAPGSFDEAASHLTKVAFVVWDEQPMGILSFDDASWAEKMVQGGEKAADGTVTLSEEISAVVHGTDMAFGSAAVCGAVASGAYDAFAKSVDFQAARASAGDAPVWGYVNLPAVTKSLTADDESEAAEVQNVMAMVGLNTVPYGVLTVQGKDTAGAATLSLKLAENQGGVLGMLPQGTPQMPALVPAGTSASLVLDWGDAGAFLAGLKKFRLDVNDSQPLTVGDQLDGMLQMWGLSIEKLGAQLGSGAAVYLPAPGSDGAMSYGDVTIVLHLKDAVGFRTTLDTVMKGMHQGLVPATFEGTEMLQMMMPPAYMKFMDDRLVIGASPAAVNRYLKAQFPPAAAPAAAAGKPAEEPTGALVLRLDTGLLTTSYPKPASGTKVYLALLRDGQEVKLSAGYTDLQPQSLSRAYMTAYFGVMAAMIMPALERARGAAMQASGAGNLHQIGLAIAMYRAEHQDQYPPDLETLVSDSFLGDPKIFVDPADKAPQARGAKGYRYSYEYAGPLPAKTPPNFIVAYTRKGVSAGGRNLLEVDGAVEFVTEEDFNQAGGGGRGPSLKEQYDWVMANSGTTLTDDQKAAFRKFYEVDATGAPLPVTPSAEPAVSGSEAPMPSRMQQLEHARAEAIKAHGMSNLHMIGLCIGMYRYAHGSQYPPDLEALVTNAYMDDTKILVDPADSAPQVRGTKGYRYSYEYPGSLPKDVPPGFILASTRKGVYPDGRIVVYADQAVQFLSEDDLHKDGGVRDGGFSLKQQYDWLIEHHGTDFTDDQKATFRKFYEVDAAATTAAGGAPLAASAGATPPQAAVPARADARVTRARSDIATLQMALDTFEIDVGRYPTNQEGLMALVMQPAGVKDWHGPYIRGPVPLDPWGHPYVYDSPGAHNSDGYDLHSFGPDGKDGGGDDIDNWSMK